jgi:hypothetical protein
MSTSRLSPLGKRKAQVCKLLIVPSAAVVFGLAESAAQ